MAPKNRKTIWEVEYLLKLLEAYVYGYRSQKDIKMWKKLKEKLLRLKNWLNSGDRWHDFGHVFLGFFITVIFAITGIWWLGGVIVAVCALVKEFFVDDYCSKDTWWDLSHYTIGVGLGYLCILLLI